MTEPQARVAHIGVAVSDLQEAAAFYRDVLGFDKPSTPDYDRRLAHCEETTHGLR